MSLQSSVGGMQTKACPLFPILKWPQGNCLISNSGKVPEGRELYFYNLSIRSVTCLQHVVALIFFSRATEVFASCQDTSGGSASCQALPPQSHSLCIQECVHVCLGTCCSREATPKVGWRGRIWKTGTAVCRKTCLPSHMWDGRPNKGADVLFLELTCGKFSLLWLEPTGRGAVNRFTVSSVTNYKFPKQQNCSFKSLHASYCQTKTQIYTAFTMM